MSIILLDSFNNLPSDIQILPQCAEELLNILKFSGCEVDFAEQFLSRTILLNNFKKKCIMLYPKKKFELIKGSKNPTLYRIGFKLKINVRIIYYIDDNEHIFLLCGFVERNKSDYLCAINIAKQRIQRG